MTESTSSAAASSPPTSPSNVKSSPAAPLPKQNPWAHPIGSSSAPGQGGSRRSQSRHFDAFAQPQQQPQQSQQHHHYSYFDDASWSPATKPTSAATSPSLLAQKPVSNQASQAPSFAAVAAGSTSSSSAGSAASAATSGSASASTTASTTAAGGPVPAAVPSVNPWFGSHQSQQQQRSVSSSEVMPSSRQASSSSIDSRQQVPAMEKKQSSRTPSVSSTASVGTGSVPAPSGTGSGGATTPSSVPGAPISAPSSTGTPTAPALVNGDEELIPTAIVIKNIPFAIKKEQLLDVMTSLGLPLPYAFNYHFDNGVFRGLAFANFTTPEETAAVISNLNGREIGGRKLRVEYKKMLPLAERERIEREKRERRGQLEEQHRGPQVNGASKSHGGGSGSGGSGHSQQHQQHQHPQHQQQQHGNHHGHHNHSHGAGHGGPSPNQHHPNGGNGPLPNNHSGGGGGGGGAHAKVDLNDPETLEFYSQLLLFRDDRNRGEFFFPASLSHHQRRIVMLLCNQLGLVFIGQDKTSGGYVVTKPTSLPGIGSMNAASPGAPPMPLGPTSAAAPPPGAGGAQPPPPHMGVPPPGLFDGSGGYGAHLYQPQPQHADGTMFPGSGAPGHGHAPPPTLRGTKSFADMRGSVMSYPYISAPGTPSGSPFYPSQTPPPGVSQHGASGLGSSSALSQQRTFSSSASSAATTQPQHHLHQHSQFLHVFDQAPSAYSSTNSSSGAANPMTSLSDSFSSIMSLGGTPLSRVPSVLASTNNQASTSPTASITSLTDPHGSAGVIGSNKGSSAGGVVDVKHDDD